MTRQFLIALVHLKKSKLSSKIKWDSFMWFLPTMILWKLEIREEALFKTFSRGSNCLFSLLSPLKWKLCFLFSLMPQQLQHRIKNTHWAPNVCFVRLISTHLIRILCWWESTQPWNANSANSPFSLKKIGTLLPPLQP